MSSHLLGSVVNVKPSFGKSEWEKWARQIYLYIIISEQDKIESEKKWKNNQKCVGFLWRAQMWKKITESLFEFDSGNENLVCKPNLDPTIISPKFQCDLKKNQGIDWPKHFSKLSSHIFGIWKVVCVDVWRRRQWPSTVADISEKSFLARFVAKMIENLFEFVNQPGPSDYFVHCRLTRHKGGLDGGIHHLHDHHRYVHHHHHHHHHHNCLQVILCQQGDSPPVTNWPHNFGISADKCLLSFFLLTFRLAAFNYGASLKLHPSKSS